MDGDESHPDALQMLKQMIKRLLCWRGKLCRGKLAELDFTWHHGLRELPSGGLADGSAATHQLLSRLTAAATEWCCRAAERSHGLPHKYLCLQLYFVPSVVLMCLAEAATAATRITGGRSDRRILELRIYDWPDDSHHAEAYSSLLRAVEAKACSLDMDLCTGPAALQSPGRLFFERRLARSMKKEGWHSEGWLQVSNLQPQVIAEWLLAENKMRDPHLRGRDTNRPSEGPVQLQTSIASSAEDFRGALVLTNLGLRILLEPRNLAAHMDQLVELLDLLHRRKIHVELRWEGAGLLDRRCHSEESPVCLCIDFESIQSLQDLRAFVKLMQSARIPETVTLQLPLHIGFHFNSFSSVVTVEATSFITEVSRWKSDISVSVGLTLKADAAAVTSFFTALRCATSLKGFDLTLHKFHSGSSVPELAMPWDVERLTHNLLADSTSLHRVSYRLDPHGPRSALSCRDNKLLPGQVDALQTVVQRSSPHGPISKVAAEFGGGAAFAFQILRWLHGCGAEPQLKKMCGIEQQNVVVQADWEAGISWVDGPPLLDLTEITPVDHNHDCHHKDAGEAAPSSGSQPTAGNGTDDEPEQEKEAGSSNADAVAEEEEVQTVAHAIYNDELLRALQESKHATEPAPAREGAAYLDDCQLCVRLELSRRGGQPDVVEILATAPELEAARRRVEESGCSLQPTFADGSFCFIPIADLGQLLEAGPPPKEGKHYIYCLQQDIPSLQAAFMRLVSRLRPSLRQPLRPSSGGVSFNPSSHGQGSSSDPAAAQSPGSPQQEEHEVREKEATEQTFVEEPEQEQRLTSLIASWRQELEMQGLEIIQDHVFIGVHPRAGQHVAERAVSSAPSDLQSMRCD